MEDKNKNKKSMIKGKIKVTKLTKSIKIKKASKTPKTIKTKVKKSPIKSTKNNSKSAKKGSNSKKKNMKQKKKKSNTKESKDKKNNIVVDDNNNKMPLNIKVIKKEKIFTNSKVGTPHFDTIKYIKTEIESKNRIINKLSLLKIKYVNELKNIHEKLQKVLLNFNETPEQKNIIRLLYFVLNVNKKNSNDSIIKKKSLKEEYNELLNKINYNSIERINEYKTRIDISKSYNLNMINQINELKNKTIKTNNLLKFEIDSKYNNDVQNLMKELDILNNTKHEALDRLKNNKKLINNCIIKFKNLLDCYENYKNENININKYILNKIDKNINILKKELSCNAQELYDKIINNQIMAFKGICMSTQNQKNSYSQIFSKNSTNNSSAIHIKKVSSVESILTKSYYDENKSRDNNKCSIRKKLLNLKLLPVINIKNIHIINKNDYNKINNNSSLIKNNNSAKIIFHNFGEKNFFDESKIDDANMNLDELYNKKQHYINISKRLDNSIKEVESMYKRKIMQFQEKLNENINKIKNIEKNNNYIRNEISSLYKILNLQKNNS